MFRIVRFATMAALLGCCTADGSGDHQSHVEGDGPFEANNANTLDCQDGLLRSANPSCCGNHWGTASAGLNHGMFASANPYNCGHHRSAIVLTNIIRSSDEVEDDVEDEVEDDVEDEVEDEVEDDGLSLSDESIDNAGATTSPASGTDADASEDSGDGLVMSSNPYCCGNHWGVTAEFHDGFFKSTNPNFCSHHTGPTAGQVDDTVGFTDVGGDSAELYTEPADDTCGEFCSGGKTDAAEPCRPLCQGQLDDTVGFTGDGGDSAELYTEPADDTCGEFCSGGKTDAAEEQLAGGSGPVNEAEDDGARFSSEQSESTVGGPPPSSAGVTDQEDSNAVPLESTFRVHQRLRKDAIMRVVLTPGSHTESASLELSVTSRHLFPSAKRAQTVQLTPDTRVQAASLENFHVSNSEGAWTFIAVNRVQRDVWVSALVHAIQGPGHTVMSDETDTTTGGDSSAPAGNPSTTDILEVNTSARGMKPRKVTLLGSELTACRVAKDGTATKSCKKMTLNRHSEVVGVTERQGEKGFNCALLRVTADPWSGRKADSWTIDAGSCDDQARWFSLIESAIHEAHDDGDIDAEKVEDPFYWRPFDARYRGWELGPKDEPLVPGLYLARLHKSPFTLEVTDIGDILMSPGHRPDRTQEPLWAHRATGSSSGLTNGGLGCVVEALWQRMMGEEETQVTLSVKNGRWRVGRGVLCTLGSSPAPEGSFRRFIPRDERGSAIRGATLQLLEDGTAVINSADGILWDSYWG